MLKEYGKKTNMYKSCNLLTFNISIKKIQPNSGREKRALKGQSARNFFGTKCKRMYRLKVIVLKFQKFNMLN